MILKDFGYKPLPIEFNPNGHRYKLEGIPLIGTTTVLGCRHKEFVKFWTVKEMYKFLDANWNIGREYTQAEKTQLLLDGKRAWTVKKDKALDSGKIAHGLIQKSIEENKRWRVKNIRHENKQVQTEIRNVYQAFLDWEKAHKVEYLATELVLGSKEHYVGGTADSIAKVDGWPEVLDWKTSNMLDDDVFLQLGSYKMMLIEGGVDERIRRRTVRLDKAGKNSEEILIKSDYVKDRDTFLALLMLYRWQRDIKKDFKDKDNRLKTKPLIIGTPNAGK